MGFVQPDRLVFGIVPWYSLIIVSAIAIGVWLCGREEKRLGLPKDTAIDSALWAVPLGIIGARLYYVAFAWDQFSSDPIRILYVWEGGVAFYGALLGGLLGVFLNARHKKVKLMSLLDMSAPAVILAQAMGRWGNFFNMEAYGELVSDPKWQFFPFAVLISGPQGDTWHLATFFYESMWDFISFALLMFFRKRMTRRGDVFLWYLLLYGAGRAVVEGLRLDSLMFLGGTARVSQWLSILAIGAVFALFAVRRQRLRGEAVPFAAAIILLAHAFFLLYMGHQTVLPYFWPWLSMAILALCAADIGFTKQKGLPIASLPLLILTAVFIVFLYFNRGALLTLPLKTAYIALISLSFPAAALAVYPHTYIK